MSNLFFSFELTPSLLAEKPLADKAASLNEHAAQDAIQDATQAITFDALLREQMSEDPLDDLHERTPASPNELFTLESHEPDASNNLAHAPAENTIGEPASPRATTEPRNAAHIEPVENELAETEAEDTLPSTLLIPRADANEAVEFIKPPKQAASKIEVTTEATVLQAPSSKWHLDRHQPRETTAASFAALPNRQPEMQRNTPFTTVRDLIGKLPNPQRNAIGNLTQQPSVARPMLTIALPNAAAPGLVERSEHSKHIEHSEHSEQPPFATPTKPIFFTNVQTAFEQLATKPDRIIEPLDALVADHVFVEVVQVSPDPTIVSDFGENSLGMPMPQRVPHAGATEAQTNLPLAQSWQPDNTDSNAKASIRPTAPTNILTKLTQPISTTPPPVAAIAVDRVNQAPSLNTESSVTTAPVQVEPTQFLTETTPQTSTPNTTTTQFTLETASTIAESVVGVYPMQSVAPQNVEASATQSAFGGYEPRPITANELFVAAEESGISTQPTLTDPAVTAIERESVAEPVPDDEVLRPALDQVELESYHISSAYSRKQDPEAPLPKGERTNTGHSSQNSPAGMQRAADIAASTPTTFAAPTPQSDDSHQAGTKPADPPIMPMGPAGVATQAEIPNKPLTVGQVVRTMLKNDHPFVQPATPNSLPYAQLELAVPQATPVTVENVIPPASPTATQLTAPSALPTTAPAQPAVTNKIFAAETQPKVMAEAKPQMTLSQPALPSFEYEQTAAAAESQPQMIAEAAPITVTESTPTTFAAPTPQLDDSHQAGTKPADPPMTPVGPAGVATQAEIPNKPLTFGQVVRTMLNNDHPFVQPATPSPLPYAQLELAVPQATPVTVENVIPPASPTATQLTAPSALPTTVPAQPAVTNKIFAAETQPTVMAEAKPQMTLSQPALPSFEYEQTAAAAESQPQMIAEAAPITVTESTPTTFAAPTPQSDDSHQAGTKPADPPITPMGPAGVATQAEIPNKPLTVGQVVRTMLKNDHPFVQPATPSPLPYAQLELAVPQATPVTVENVIPPASPTATQLTAPSALPTTAPAQPAVTNKIFAAETQPKVMAEAKPQMTLSQPALPSFEYEQTAAAAESQPQMIAEAAPITVTEPHRTKIAERPAPQPGLAALGNAAAAPVPVSAAASAVVPEAVSAESPASAAVVATEKSVAPTLPNVPLVAPQSRLATELNHGPAELAFVLPVVSEGIGRIQHHSFTTTTVERSSKPGQRTFQMVLQLPTTVSTQVQPAFESEVSNPVAAANQPKPQSTEPLLMPLPLTTIPVGTSAEPAERTQPNARPPHIQTSSETLPNTPVDAVPRTQVLSPVVLYEVAPSSPLLITEPLRTTLSSIEQHFANVVSALPDSSNAGSQPPTQVVNNAPALSEPALPVEQQVNTQRELELSSSLQIDWAAREAITTTTSRPAVNARATITRVFLSPTAAAPGTTDLTDEWLGERQIPDPPGWSTNPESVRTLTPTAAATAQNTTPEATAQSESTSVPTYFSANVTPAAWATNIVTEHSPTVWKTSKPYSAGAARGIAALNHTAGPASHASAQVTGKADFPWLVLNTPPTEPSALADKAPKPERSDWQTADAAIVQPTPKAPEVSIETTPTKPLERVVWPPPGLIERSALPGATGELVLPRVALEHPRAVERPQLPEPAAERTARLGAESALPTFDPRMTPTPNVSELDLQPASLQAGREDKEELAVNGLADSAPLLLERGLERGTTVAQKLDTGDGKGSHVARQLAEPLMTASAELAPNEPRTIRLKLRPESLGEVEIVLTRDMSGQYHAHMSAEREQTTHVLRGQLGQLREALEQVGLQVGQLEITTSTDQRGQGWSAGGRDGQHTHTPQTRIPEADFSDSEPAAQSGPITAQDRLINLHA